MVLKWLFLLITSLCPALLLAQTLTFAAAPYPSEAIVLRQWTPIIEELNATTGLNIRFISSKDQAAFEARLHGGELDLAYLDPGRFLQVNESMGFRALIRPRKGKIKSLILVPRESEIKQLTDLTGAKLGLPPTADFAASQLPLAEIQHQQINVTPVFLESADDVFQAINEGTVAAGGVNSKLLYELPPNVKELYRTLWSSPEYFAAVIAAHPRLSPELQKKIAKSLFAMSYTPKGRSLVGRLGHEAFSYAKDSDWDHLQYQFKN